MPLPRRRGGSSSPNLLLLGTAGAAAVVVGAAAFAAWRRRMAAHTATPSTAPSTRVNSSGFLSSWLGASADSQPAQEQPQQQAEGTHGQQQDGNGATTTSGGSGTAEPKATVNGGASTTPSKVSSPDRAGPGPESASAAAAGLAAAGRVATTAPSAAAPSASSPATPASARRPPMPPVDSPASSAAFSPPGVSSESVVSPSAVRTRVRRAEGEATPVWVTAAAWGSPLSGGGTPGGATQAGGGPLSGGREAKRPRHGPAVAARVAAVAAAEAEAEARSGSPARAPRPLLAIPSSPRFTMGKPFIAGSTPSAATPRASFQPFGRPSDVLGDALTTPMRSSGGGAAVAALRRSFSGARALPQPQPEIFCVESPLPEVLQAQYGSGASALHERISVLAERYCDKLMDITGELGEPTALDVGCMAGALTFCMASSFRHVLGIEADAQLVLAAKELKETGELEYFLPAGDGGEEVARKAVVDQDIDRDRVRFWHCPNLPSLPPKLATVDAVVIEDGHGRIHRGLARLLDQVPAALNPRGICVVALPASGSGGPGTTSPRAPPPADSEDSSCSGADVDSVKRRMAALGLELVHEERRPLPSSTGGGASPAPATKPTAAVLLVWKAPGVGEAAPVAAAAPLAAAAPA